MVADKMKFDLKEKESNCFLDKEFSPKSDSKLKVWLSILFLLIISISSFVVSVCALLSVQTCNEEFESLRSEIEKLKNEWMDDELLNEIKHFKIEDLFDDDTVEGQTLQSWLVNGGDDLDLDYDLNYDDTDEHNDEEQEATDKIYRFIQDEISDDKTNNDFSPDHEDITSLMKGGSLTKVGKETKRMKRDIVPSTVHGIPINSKSYADTKKRNKTHVQQHGHLSPIGGDGVQSPIPSFEGGYKSPAWLNRHQSAQGLTHYEELETKNPTPFPPAVTSRKSSRFTQPVKRPQTKSGSHQRENVIERNADGFTVVRDEQHHRRGHRQRGNLETLDERTPRRMRALPAIHFSGDTSKYVFGQHTNFNGNGHLRHLDQTYVDWKVDDWVKTLGMDQHFQVNDGRLTIKESGLYFIYAQIYYLDQHDTNGYRVYKNQRTPVLQCTTMTHSMDRVIKGNTCYTAGMDYLIEGDQISVKDLADGRYSLFESGKSFFGVLKLGDVKTTK